MKVLVIIKFLENHFVPIAAKFGSQRHLVAIRDGFVAIMPLILVGALAVLINNFPIDSYQDFMNQLWGSGWKDLGGVVWTGTFAIMALLVTFSISYSLATSYKADGLAASLVSFAALFMLYTLSEDGSTVSLDFFGAQGLFVCLFASIISTEIFVKLAENPKLIISMPNGVPPAIAKSFASLIPAVVSLIIFGIIRCIASKVGIPNIHEAIYQAIQAPISGLADHMGSAILVAFLIHILWFFGLHGDNIVAPLLNAVYLPATNDNIAAFQAGLPIPHIITMPFFNSFVLLGGSGATICLIIALFIAGKRKNNRNLAKLSIAPGMFNINEPMIFGIPIVLNPLYLVPFVLSPIILAIVSYLAIAVGLVPKTIAMLPWTTPPIISGFLATGSIMGAILSIVNLVIGVAIYMPFVILAEKYDTNIKDSAQTSNSAKNSKAINS